MRKVDGNEVGTWDGFIYIIWGDKAKTICHTANGDESDTFISLNDCLALVGFAEGEEVLDNVIVILEDFTRGTVYRYNNYGDKIYNSKAKRNDYSQMSDWDSERIAGGIFDLIFDCSDEQIIFGGNYYTDILAPTKSWIVWDKRMATKMDRNDFADCELAWCSKGVARVINYMYNGMIQEDMRGKEFRFHPTQKPSQMWCKILSLYTEEGDLILDPFAGSQSLRIACHKMNRRYIGFEIDKDYYEKGCKWFENESSQLTLF